MSATATKAQIRAYAMSKPHATKVRFRANGWIEIQGMVPRNRHFGWYALGRVEDLAHMLPLRAADGDEAAIAALKIRGRASG